MTRYKQADFADEDSIGSIQINETRSPTMKIRYHAARGTSLWNARSKLEKLLILLLMLSIVLIVVLSSLLANDSTRILHVRPHVGSGKDKGKVGGACRGRSVSIYSAVAANSRQQYKYVFNVRFHLLFFARG